MLKRVLFIAVMLALGTTPALAQSTATPVIPGYLTTSGCPSGYTSCFVAYGSSIPVTGTIATITGPVGVKGKDGSTISSVTNPLPVLGGGYELNASVIPTVQNAAYAAGQSLGGLQTIAAGTTTNVSGIVDQLRVASKGGSTVSVVVYAWSKNPTNTTCTDKSNFVVSQADNEFLIGPPMLITPALGVSAQDTTTYGSATNLTDNFIANTTNLYVCILANASVTPATTSDYRFNIQGVKDQP